MKYSMLTERFEAILTECQHLFTSDDLSEVRHYLDHGEIEMAVEGFCLELLRKNVVLPENIRTRVKVLAQDVRLDKESVFDAEIWQKLETYLSRSEE
jgi:hypothetical protein